MSGPVTIVTRATPAHVEDWARLRDLLWPEDGIDSPRSAIVEHLAADDDRVAFVAVEGDTVLGFAEAGIRHDPVNGCDTSPVAFLEGIAVDPSRRRGGLARALAQAVEAWARGRGCDELGSDAGEANVEGQALHRGLGFEERERVVFYRKLLSPVARNGSTLS